jgi:predicted nucleic acid-binding protein
MIVTLDVSAAIEILLQKDKKDKFDKVYKSAEWVIAPDLFVSEITNAFWKYNRAGILTHEECTQYVEDGINMVDDFIESKEIWKEALGESIKNNHPVYDMCYAILTRRHDGALISNDKELSILCKKLKIECVF